MEDADKRETEQVGEDPGNEVEMPKAVSVGQADFSNIAPQKTKINNM